MNNDTRHSSPPAFRTDRRGFFAHHGIWAPGIRTFRRLDFKSKAALIMFSMSVPIVMLSLLFYQPLLEARRFAEQERSGVAYAKTAVALLQAVGRGLSLEVTGESDDGARTQARRDITVQLQALQTADASLGKLLQTSESLAETVKAHEALMANGHGNSAVDQTYSKYRTLAMSVGRLVVKVTDTSGLSLDPDLDSYYLMDSAILRLPVNLERHHRLGVLGVLATRAQDDARSRFMKEANRVEALAEEQFRGVVSGLAKVTAVHPELGSELATKELASALSALRKNATTSADPEAAVKQMQTAIQQGWSLQAAASADLDRVLASRIDAIQRKEVIVGAVIGVAVLVACYLFHSFFLVMSGGLQKVERHLMAMADGDLTQPLHPWGRDEPARLMFSLKRMQESLSVIVTDVRSASTGLVHASHEISNASTDLSQRSEQAASHLQESTSAMEQIASAVGETATATATVTQLAADNAQIAVSGGLAVEDLLRTMTDVQRSSDKVGDIVNVIDGIAFQTNILALNAAVEAARAGEQGRGFAVVAAEVRALATRCSSAAKEIKALIGDSTSLVQRGNENAGRAGEQIHGLQDAATKIQQVIEKIMADTRQQESSVYVVRDSIRTIDQQTQQNAALVEQTAAAAHHLKEHAEVLAGRVAQFRLAS